MGLTKTAAFSVAQNQLAEYAKAFAHPARVAILEHLLAKNACICSDLVEVLPLSQSTVSQHLKELKRVGLIRGEVEGPKVCYCIDPDNWRAATAHLQRLLHAFPPPNTCC
jgi:ArsR family transcriptional regulator